MALRNLSEVEIAWIAGLLEGEGSFGLGAYHSGHNGNRGGVRSLRITCGMTDLDTIKKLKKTIDGGHFNLEGRKDPRRIEISKPLFVWQMSRRNDCIELLNLILPHMSARRSAKIQELLDYAEANPMTYGQPAEHGSQKSYRRGCRCDACVVVGKEYGREKARRSRENAKAKNQLD